MPGTTNLENTDVYQLNLQPQKSNVFVTQLTVRDDDVVDDVRKFPVVQEASDLLLQTGVNTLQKTSLLRKAVEVKQVDDELSLKREEFHKRMMANKSKMEALIKKQQKIKERVGKFDRFLKENEAKRSRALHKYQIEVKHNQLRAKELAELKDEIGRLHMTKLNLLEKLDQHKKFEEFMSEVVERLPDGFMPFSGENLIKDCIQRYEGLSATQQSIIERNREQSIKVEIAQRELEMMHQKKYEEQLLFSQEVADLLSKKDKLVEKNSGLEQMIAENQKTRRFMASVLGQVLLSIDNLALLCHSRHWPPLAEMSYEAKLIMIKRKFEDQVRVLKLVEKMAEGRFDSLRTTKLPPLTSQCKGHTAKVYNASTIQTFKT